MTKYIKCKSYPSINEEDSSKTLDIVNVKIVGDKSLKVWESGVPFFRIDPEYGPRKYNTPNKITPASQPDKIIDENH